MRFWKTCLVIGLLGMSGCATGKWQGETTPYPQTTPFDSHEFARSIYMEGFRQGYRFEKFGDATTIDMLTGPNLHARRLGYYAGAARARAEMAENRE